jgi:hypothetical protein
MELIKTYLSDSLDASFDKIFQKKYTEISKIHWTPIEVAKIATNWLAKSDETKVLDIGSGVGKFCVVGALISDAHFYGVEKRSDLVRETNRLKNKLNLNKIQIINENVVNINFKDFDSFYYFNPFCEQIAEYGLIDDTINPSEINYENYQSHVFDQLEKTKIGARLVTYCSSNFSPPHSFRIKDMMFDGELVFWEKMKN